jgi:excisionase family DNA binding protein
MSDPKFSFEPLLDSDQAAAILRIHPKTLQRLARSGRVTGYRIGNLWRFHASDLQASMIGANTVLDSNTVQQYSLTTTRARN